MAGRWRFDPSTKTLVKRVRKMLTPEEREERNKWMAAFKEEFKDNEFGMTLYSLLETSAINRDKREAAGLEYTGVPKRVNPADALCESVEAEPIASFNHMLEEGCKNHSLFQILAKRLPKHTVDKICQHMFETKNLRLQDVETFICEFFPVFLKRAHGWSSVDIMIRANKAYPQPFRSLMQLLLQDLELSNNVINDYVLAVEDAGKYEFMSWIMDFELSDEEFLHNLVSITSAYKGAEKTERLQNYIYNTLLAHSMHCASNGNYGRLLLEYIYSLSHGKVSFDIRMMERLIDVHHSPFKRPCLMVLGEAIKALDEAAIPPYPT